MWNAMEETLHSIGPYHVSNGSMYFKDNPCFWDEDIAIIVDIEEDGIGTLLKVGRYEELKAYYDNMISKYISKGLQDLANCQKLIKFNVKFEGNKELGVPEFAPEGYNLTVDEICTIINRFSNYSLQNLGEFFEMDLPSMKAKIQKWQEAGC